MKLHTIIMAGLALTASPTLACDLTKLPFGGSADSVAQTFGFEGVDAGDMAEADTRASTVCETLPSDAVMRFTFLKGKLARASIESHKGTGELLVIAEKNFGKADQRPMENDKLYKSFKQHWAQDGKPLVVYTMQPVKEQEHVSEYLAIVSREYKDEWEDVMQKDEKSKKTMKAKTGR